MSPSNLELIFTQLAEATFIQTTYVKIVQFPKLLRTW